MSNVYAPTILGESGLISYWRLGEGSGTSAADSKGTNTGEYKNAPTLGAAASLVGDPNTAVTLNGTNQYITVPHSSSLDVGDVFTYEAWIKRAEVRAVAEVIGSRQGSPTAKLDITAAGKLRLRIPGVKTLAESTIEIADTSWHHIVATKNGATVKLYIDSVDRTGAVTNETVGNNVAALIIGSESPTEEFFKGTLDEVAIYNVALSGAQALDHYQKAVSAASSRSLLGVGR
jgi:hypothetical protein